jgi:two-component system cell cycle response regulator CtrA
MMMDWYRIAHERKARIDELEETVRQLRDILRPKATLPPEWDLTEGESRLVVALALRDVLSNDAAHTASAKHAERVALDNTVKVMVHRVRRKLAPFGVKIGTAWGQGYYLTDKSRQIVKSAFGAVDEVENAEIN